MASIDDSYIDNGSGEESMGKKYLGGVWYGNYVHSGIIERDAKMMICYRIIQAQNEWKQSALIVKRMGEILHRVFKAVVNELNNYLPTLVQSGPEVSHLIPDPRNFA